MLLLATGNYHITLESNKCDQYVQTKPEILNLFSSVTAVSLSGADLKTYRTRESH